MIIDRTCSAVQRPSATPAAAGRTQASVPPRRFQHTGQTAEPQAGDDVDGSHRGRYEEHMAKKPASRSARPRAAKDSAARPGRRPSALLDTRIIYCGDCLDQLAKLPDGCVDLIYIDPPFNSNRNYEVFWGEGREKRAFEDRHASTQAYIDYMRPRCVKLARVLKKTGSFTNTATGTAVSGIIDLRSEPNRILA